MSLKVPKANNIQLFKEGYKHLQGLDEAVLRNIQAVNELSDLVRTSFGPNGRNKLLINHLGRLFVTSDAATIIREVEVVHPAAKLLVMASQAQEAEMGDATNLVIILAGELLKKSEQLLVMGLVSSEIVKGYEMACAKALEELEKLSTSSLPSLVPPPSSSKSTAGTSAIIKALSAALKPPIASKQYSFEESLSSLVAEAALAVMPPNPKNFNVDNVRVVKIMGGSLAQSRVVRGMVFGREPEGQVKKASRAKVAVFTCALDIAQTETKGTVLLKNAEEMLNFTRGEELQLEKIFKEIAESGVQVIVAGSAVGDLALHYLNRFNIAVLKVLSKFDLRRVCRVVGATPLARVGAPTPEEAGYVDVFESIEIGGDRVTVVRQLTEGEEGFNPSGVGEKSRMATIVLRGATANHLDDLERAVDDGVNVIKSLIKDPRLVPGAGATELELARRVVDYGAGLKGLSQHSVKRFGEALEVVPRQLAENAMGGAKGNEVVSRLWALHESKEKGREGWGIDVEAETDGTLHAQSAPLYPILDSLIAKSWAIKLATEAAVSVLSVDSIIMSKPAGGPKIPQQSGNWDDDD
ncbi:T-complex protein 1 [Dendrothele bispora CBS 962.96]|uniref:CCT-theta n=1 Tax=Dendrothele bispora (strain CBS 962.96) TaxID=1314807 RepID=A0A4S8LME2_DENBC|nr:T-complex protein 1 [Dendrothele bispora CBS 962.96]